MTFEDGMSKFKEYKRKNIAEMRPYVLDEDLTGISVALVDHPHEDMGMIARNPQNHKDQWYVARKYFEENFEEISDIKRHFLGPRLLNKKEWEKIKKYKEEEVKENE